VKVSEIASRLTGFTLPFFGASWQPPELEVTVARRLIAFLEDRRVLYSPSELEVPFHCVSSVLEIRRFISAELGRLSTESNFSTSLRAMRAACRKFLDQAGENGKGTYLHANEHGHYASWEFYSALGEMRGVFGIHIAMIATQFKLNVEDDLASILPLSVDSDVDNGKILKLI
jgi:hypothetical protein